MTASFRDELAPNSVGPISHSAIARLGRAGWIGRGEVMILIGWFLTRSAVRFDPNDALGIDGALCAGRFRNALIG